MLHLRTLGFLAGLGLLLSAAPAHAQRAGGAGVAPGAAPVAAPAASPVENSVVKIFASVRYPDYYKPWTKLAPEDFTGSGVVIDGKRILTCAHVVLYAGEIQIQASQSGDKVSAHVESIAPGIDLAVLKLDDESFFDAHQPLPRLKQLPGVTDTVMAYGYPRGGSSLSITKGIVSRIEFAGYNAGTAGLRIQIDAALNPGNSGGPAVVDDKMIGLAMSRLTTADNIGYIIPNEEIDLFLKDIADGHYDGKPAFHGDVQNLENAALRRRLKLDASVRGALMTRTDSDDPDYPLKQWDVITRIGDAAVDDEGMVKLDANLRVFFAYMAQKTARNGAVPMTIIRDGKELHLDVPVVTNRLQIIPDLAGAYPSYFVFGPMAFTAATAEFVNGLTGSTQTGHRMLGLLIGSGSPLVKRLGDKPAFDGEQLVAVSSPFFPHKLVEGYANPMSEVVKSVNGIPVKNLAHLVEILRDCRDEFLLFEFDQRRPQLLVFPRAEMAAATDDILTDNGVRSQGSPDMMAVWNAHPAGQ